MNSTDFHVLFSGQSGAGPFPPPPTRDEILTSRYSMQGLTVEGQHWWDPMLGSPFHKWATDKAARMAFYPVTRAAGNTGVVLTLEGTYDHPEEGLRSLDRLLPIMKEAVTEGGMRNIALFCRGDGAGPQGPAFDQNALGFYWLMQNFPEIYKRVTDYGLKGYTLFVPGFDGVNPGWPTGGISEYLLMARSVVGDDGFLGLENSAGYLSWTGEENDYDTDAGRCLDVVLQEGPIDQGPPDCPPSSMLLPNGDWRPDVDTSQWDQLWQIIARAVPHYNRPACQPPNDDPNRPPWMLKNGTPRGPFGFVGFEYDTYSWVRLNGYPIETVEEHRQSWIDLGCPVVC